MIPNVSGTNQLHISRVAIVNSWTDKKAVQFFYARHVCRVDPFPQDLLDSIAQMEADDVGARNIKMRAQRHQ